MAWLPMRSVNLIYTFWIYIITTISMELDQLFLLHYGQYNFLCVWIIIICYIIKVFNLSMSNWYSFSWIQIVSKSCSNAKANVGDIVEILVICLVYIFQNKDILIVNQLQNRIIFNCQWIILVPLKFSTQISWCVVSCGE